MCGHCLTASWPVLVSSSSVDIPIGKLSNLLCDRNWNCQADWAHKSSPSTGSSQHE